MGAKQRKNEVAKESEREVPELAQMRPRLLFHDAEVTSNARNVGLSSHGRPLDRQPWTSAKACDFNRSMQHMR
jgi:hypothetical protein